MNKSFGQNLADLLKSKNVKALLVAKETGIPISSFYEWVGDRKKIPRNAEYIKKISLYFNVSVHELLYGYQEDLFKIKRHER